MYIVDICQVWCSRKFLTGYTQRPRYINIAHISTVLRGVTINRYGKYIMFIRTLRQNTDGKTAPLSLTLVV